MTAAAQHFVSAETFRDLTGRSVATSLWREDSSHDLDHIDLANWADLVAIAPATANLISRAAVGMADDVVSTVLLATNAPIVMAPAMESRMWDHPVIRDHVLSLKLRGVRFAGPTEGRLASGVSGMGRMAEPEDILEVIRGALKGEDSRRDLEGLSLLVTAGPTREPIDPVRYISNRSSGKMGYAIARAGHVRGAQVALIAGPVDEAAAGSLPSGIEVIKIETASEMTQAVLDAAPKSRVIIMAAAVADFKPTVIKTRKLKKGDQPESIAISPTIDILSLLREHAPHALRVGFAAETHDLVAHATAKLNEKGLAMIVANDVGDQDNPVFGSDDNKVTILRPRKQPEKIPSRSKQEVAHIILDRILALISSSKS